VATAAQQVSCASMLQFSSCNWAEKKIQAGGRGHQGGGSGWIRKINDFQLELYTLIEIPRD